METRVGLNDLLLSHWSRLERYLSQDVKVVIESGQTNLAAIVASTRYRRSVYVADTVWDKVKQSAEIVHGHLQGKRIIYGINTGFGANADARTTAHVAISRGLIRALHYGVVTGPGSNQYDGLMGKKADLSASLYADAVSMNQPDDTFMPESWVRAMMLIRAISLSKGVSGVRPHVIENMIALLNANLSPVVPLRGSISASGDLSPLSYIGGVLQGKPILKVMSWSAEEKATTFVTAEAALKQAKIAPLDVGPKEGLAIVNGTAASAGVACLAIHESLWLVLFAQVLTAGTVEATNGSIEGFSSFLSDIRPHEGQKESAANILAFLNGSRLVTEFDDEDDSSRQDRYSTRTSPQWLGPSLEDIMLAYTQVVTEIDSVTDNPVINPESGRFVHGGNFQAKSITSAMDKTRLACQAIGQMIFAQCTEIINPHTSCGLPPNLVVDEPNESWMWKGTDICIAALQAELGFLANPATHVQFAEQGNQAINSLALISARYTMTALDVLTQMMAAHTVALCQAFDLRIMQMLFLQAFQISFQNLTKSLVETISTQVNTDTVIQSLWRSFVKQNSLQTHIPSHQRFENVVGGLYATLLVLTTPQSHGALEKIAHWKHECVQEADRIYKQIREECVKSPKTADYLGPACKVIYQFVRNRIGVPFFGEEYSVPAEWQPRNLQPQGPGPVYVHQSMGEMITAVYLAMRSGALPAAVVEMLAQITSKSGHRADKRYNEKSKL